VWFAGGKNGQRERWKIKIGKAGETVHQKQGKKWVAAVEEPTGGGPFLAQKRVGGTTKGSLSNRVTRCEETQGRSLWFWSKEEQQKCAKINTTKQIGFRGKPMLRDGKNKKKREGERKRKSKNCGPPGKQWGHWGNYWDNHAQIGGGDKQILKLEGVEIHQVKKSITWGGDKAKLENTRIHRKKGGKKRKTTPRKKVNRCWGRLQGGRGIWFKPPSKDYWQSTSVETKQKLRLKKEQIYTSGVKINWKKANTRGCETGWKPQPEGDLGLSRII